ncbi:VTT domain-containing protein [Verrucomicrobiales bacterium BCK34]|nr:VTT domain-containing protein [Verrucomicrobiales bacterium BCK34]
MKRLLILFFALALLVLIPFLIWGDMLEEKMSLDSTVAWLRSTGSWAWAAGMGLLIIDLFLPILGTVVMSALGLVYGWFLGGLLSALGSIGAGLLAYGLCWKMGRRAAGWLAGEEGLAQGERIFRAETGGWLVALSRWMPLLPEVIACLAGISRMPFRRFFLSLCAGSFPLGFVFAWIGATGNENPWFTLLVSAGLPPVIWLLFRQIYLRKAEKELKKDSKHD